MVDEPRLRSFAPVDRADFETDLAEAAEYFVAWDGDAGHGGQLVACGGLWLDGRGVGSFVWSMVRRGLHAQDSGRLQVGARLERLRELGAREVRLDTSQRTAPFYSRFGFQEVGAL